MTPAVVLLAGLSAAAPVPPATRLTPASELARLQGDWLYERLTADGKAVDMKLCEVQFTGRAMWKADGFRKKFDTVGLDPSVTPHRITLTNHDYPLHLGPDGPIPSPRSISTGLYRLDGDTLTLAFCLDRDRGPPSRIDPSPGAGQWVAVLRRARQPAPPPRPAR